MNGHFDNVFCSLIQYHSVNYIILNIVFGNKLEERFDSLTLPQLHFSVVKMEKMSHISMLLSNILRFLFIYLIN